MSNKWPGVEDRYFALIDEQREGEHKIPLGIAAFVEVQRNIWVAHMVAQRGLRAADNKRPLRYTALMRAMKIVAQKIETIREIHGKPVTIHCPKFGSDLAGGNWEFIEALIEEIWLEKGIDVVAYEFEG